MIKKALISVYDKTGLVDFALSLKSAGVKILSTGKTAKLLRENSIEVEDVSNYTGFPEMMDGRVKTLHPNIHGGILALRDNKTHLESMKKNNIIPIDLVVVNLYPFEDVTSKPETDLKTAVENIDIGGPSMIRSAAKNHKFVTVVVDPDDYSSVIKEIKSQNDVSEKTRQSLALKAFRRTADYDSCIDNYLSKQFSEDNSVRLSYSDGEELRYGENPHQKATFFRDKTAPQNSVAKAKILNGKQLSYNNIIDANAALNLIAEFKGLACAILKHTNPCGCALGKTCSEAFRRALECDPVSAFGGIVAFNKRLDLEAAKEISKMFIEIVIAPEFESSALEELMKKKNLRLLETGMQSILPGMDLRKVDGGLLVQDKDIRQLQDDEFKCVTKLQPSENQVHDLRFAWKVVRHVKSNAILYCKDGQTVGVGAGQMSRVDSAKVAVMKAKDAGLSLEGAVLASDAFFPFPDGVETAAKAGIKAIIQPGGSVRDKEVIESADKNGISMVFTGIRAFKH